MTVESSTIADNKENAIENRYQTSSTSTSTTSPNKQYADEEDVFSAELLKMYYSRLFPLDMLYSWISYDPMKKHPHVFSRREFSFTIDGMTGEEIYCRHKCFKSEQELKDAIVKAQPRKIDIGCVNSHSPKDRRAFENYCPVQRELVFDIDLTDYDSVRLCGCTGATICNKCWTFMTMAVKLMDQGLRQDFGFEQIAWFYSGRRGVHAWVCDEAARHLSDPARTAVANYFEMPNVNNGLHLPLHPCLARAFEILEPMFVESVLPESGHGLLAKSEHWEALLDTLPPAASNVRDLLMEKWADPRDLSTPAEKWTKLKSHLQYFSKKASESSSAKRQKQDSAGESIEKWPIQVVFQYTYPRLDINVSKRRDHLLKSPFCVHPKTGRVCVPIQVDQVDTFDPFQVPTLPQLMKELDAFAAVAKDTTMDIEEENNNKDETESKKSKKLKDWQKTSLKEYFEPFQKRFLELLLTDLRHKEREASEQTAARIGDF